MASAAEKAQKEQALLERLEKRAVIVVTVLHKFVNAFYAGRQQMLDEARAAAAAKKARKGKKRAKKSKTEDKRDAKGGKEKAKAKKTPVQESWSSFLTDMDDRISKQKRVGLEDMYRGVAKLEEAERAALRALLATTNKKILPLDGLNISQLNIKEALAAAVAAVDMERDKSVPSSMVGLKVLTARGAAPQQVLSQGYEEADLLRAGVPRHELVATAQHHLPKLREAGILVDELLTSPTAPELAQRVTEGYRGLAELRKAQYTAVDVLAAGAGDVWSMARAGYTMSELREAQVPASELRAAGFGVPEGQPAHLLASSMRTITTTHASAIPPLLSGTQDPVWTRLTAPAAAAAAAAASPGATGKQGFSSRQGVGVGAVSGGGLVTRAGS